MATFFVGFTVDAASSASTGPRVVLPPGSYLTDDRVWPDRQRVGRRRSSSTGGLRVSL